MVPPGSDVVDSKFDALPALMPGLEGVFEHAHFGDRVAHFDHFRQRF